MSHHRLILLGTGTDVGKTYLGCEIAHRFREGVGPVLGLKPIESGFNDASEGDAAALRQAASHSPLPLYRFAPPISPHLAARRIGTEIELQRVVDWVKQEEQAFRGREPRSAPTLTIIETAGGVFSPISPTATNLDLVKQLGDARIMLVAPDALGVLHDVQASLRAMAPFRVDVVVLSESRAADDSTGTNGAELEQLVFPQLVARELGEIVPRDSRVLSLGRGGSGEALVDWILAR